MSDGLPKGWVSLQIEDLTENPKQDIVDGPFGSDLKASEYVDKGVPVVRLQNIDRNRFLEKNIRFISSLKARELSRHSFCAGDIIITKLGNPVGKACIVPDSIPQGIIVADVVRARIDKRRAWKEFVTFAINSPRISSDLNFEVKGSTRPRVNLGHIRKLEIQVPPLNEQLRIVVKLEKLLGRVDTCQQRLTKIPIILKRFRQSVLAAACSGRLTAYWRQKNQTREVTENPDLPIGWHWMPIKELLPPGGIFDGPFGSNLKTVDYTDKGVRVVRLENISSLRFIHSKETYISQEKYEILAKHTICAGDLIFASFIDEEVRACILPKLPTKAIAKADCFCLRPRKEVIDSHYLAFQLVSRESYGRLSESVHGATRPRINTTQLRNLEVRICSLGEQQEIVRRVEALFELADQIEARFTKAKSRVDQLTQSLLAKAFRGELVPKDSNDEPASVLLERIKAERAKREVEVTGKQKEREIKSSK